MLLIIMLNVHAPQVILFLDFVQILLDVLALFSIVVQSDVLLVMSLYISSDQMIPILVNVKQVII